MSATSNYAVRDAGVVVIGSGLAGLSTALHLAHTAGAGPVVLLTKTGDLPGGSSLHAQGGIAAAIAPGDRPEHHAADTIAAGAGFVDPAMADLLTREGVERLHALIEAGLPFDRNADGTLSFGREAAHGAARVVHAGGDATGRTLVTALSARVREAGSIRVETNAFAVDLAQSGGRIRGVLASHPGGWVLHRTSRVVLATGGIGGVYARTTNPREATGDGLALAARAGAVLADLEFVQFHPTALAVDCDPAPLLTEALRGAGAWLLDGRGRRFMLDEHPLAELAPRDVVARAVGRRAAAGEPVHLDLRPALEEKPGGFPTVLALCAAHGLSPFEAPVPVAPAAHYHMGGVVTDAFGRTSVEGLWACGEVACTGVHGANRLASNSLLEALVFSARVAASVCRAPTADPQPFALPEPPRLPGPTAVPLIEALSAETRRVLYEGAGLVRSGAGLRQARARLDRLSAGFNGLGGQPSAASHAPDARTARCWGEARNRLLVGRLLLHAALARTESRGAHFRTDCPAENPAAQRHSLTIDALSGQTVAGALSLTAGDAACSMN